LPVSRDQDEIVAFLGDPRSYGAGIDRVDRHDTHISHVFLAGDRAYKLKRAVRFPYLDFSTPRRRRLACEAELSLNRRTAPELYLEVRGIGRTREGRIGWTTRKGALDWVVVMRRFGQDQLLDALARAGSVDERLLLDLVAHIAAFHAQAETRRDFGGSTTMAALIEANEASLRHAGIFPKAEIAALHARSRDALDAVSDLLDARRDAGKVRRCHGDLHLRNIAVIDGQPILFDCIEFSERIATIDVLYDLAFLLMDLLHRGLGPFANLVANRYLDLTDEDAGLPALPLFLSVRAAIRAHVAVSQGGADDEARAYLALARSLLAPAPPRLIAIGGLSGTGKSTIARAVAPALGAAPGARVLRSDVIRKRLCGAAPETPLPGEAYGPEMTARVYRTLCDKALGALRAGFCAVVDAVALRPEERGAFAAVAATAGVPFAGIWLQAPAATMAARIRARRGDASDATEEVLSQQLSRDPGDLAWQRVDVGGDRAASIAAVRQFLAP